MRLWVKRSLYLLPAILAIGGIGSYFIVASFTKNETTSSSKAENNVNSISQDLDNDTLQVFPKLKQQDFYSFVKIKDGQPVINSDMIAQIVNYIVTKMQVSDGEVAWGYYQPNLQSVIINFTWTPSDLSIFLPIEKAYFFTLSK